MFERSRCQYIAQDWSNQRWPSVARHEGRIERFEDFERAVPALLEVSGSLGRGLDRLASISPKDAARPAMSRQRQTAKLEVAEHVTVAEELAIALLPATGADFNRSVGAFV